MESGTVQIPSDHFAKAVRLQYSNPNEALIREILQNSLDAGATIIELEVDENHLTAKDNGCGMDKNTLINGMLTFGGSIKKEGDIGGFGLAKEIILFQHSEYEIRTKQFLVHGKGLSYNIEAIPEVVGTEIKVKFHPLAAHNKEKLEKCIRSILLKSYFFTTSVYLNGAQLCQGQPSPSRCVRNLKWCKLLVDKNSGYEDYYVHVRYNGLFMFSHYVGQYYNKVCTVELIGKSKEVLTGTRDGLIGDKYEQLQELLNRLIINPLTFGSESIEPKWVFFRGNTSYLQCLEPENLVKGSKMLFDGYKENNLQAALVDLAELMEHSKEDIILEKVREAQTKVSESRPIDIIEEILQSINTKLQSDFVVHLDNKEWRRLPSRYKPEKLKGRPAYIIRTWKYCVAHVLKASKNFTAFRIGWVFDESKKACYTTRENIPTFLINPESIKNIPTKELLYEIMAIACHEIAHLHESNHNETYASVLTDTFAATLKNMDNRKQANAKIKAQHL